MHWTVYMIKNLSSHGVMPLSSVRMCLVTFLEDVGIKKNIRDMAFNKIGNTLLNAGGFGKKLSKWVKDPIGRYLSKVMDPKILENIWEILKSILMLTVY